MIVGAAAWYELWQSRRAKHCPTQTLNVVLGLAFVTMGLMVVVDELGWEINHFELHLPPKEGPYMAPGTTPETWSHVHMILNHFPTVGFVFALVFFLIALATNNEVMKRAEPRRLRHLRHPGRADLRHRRRFDVGADRSSDPGDHQGPDQ